MKFITLFFFFFVVNTYADTKCSPEMQALQYNSHGHVELKTVNHENGFSMVEKKMIHKVVTIQEYLKDISEQEAVDSFNDVYEGEIGYNAGEIVYFKVGKKFIAKVHYYPGDNEFGAYVEVVGKTIKIHAEINDGDLYCL